MIIIKVLRLVNIIILLEYILSSLYNLSFLDSNIKLMDKNDKKSSIF
ncbi:MAG: hypothetical protein Q607_CBUC00180G0018 [Clostridium butyricum DORA_1]|nr:MAG: hypothetical protein Q607_CBUC00180G0018 [Clostridium butyricum DORA_1]